MRGVVLDAWAVLALLRGERPAGDVVRRYVRRTTEGRFEVLLNVVNLGEVLYRLIQIDGRASAIDRFERFRRGPITIVPAPAEGEAPDLSLLPEVGVARWHDPAHDLGEAHVYSHCRLPDHPSFTQALRFAEECSIRANRSSGREYPPRP